MAKIWPNWLPDQHFHVPVAPTDVALGNLEGQKCENMRIRLKQQESYRIMNKRTMVKGQRCTETIHGMGAVNCDLSMKALGADQRTYIVLTQHTLVVMTLHMNQTFIHCVIAQCAGVSKREPQHMHCDSMKAFGADQCTHVMITQHNQVD